MPPLTAAVVLVCAMSMPPDKCTAQTALYSTEIPLKCSINHPEFRPQPLLPAQNTAEWRDWKYYFKTSCVPAKS